MTDKIPDGTSCNYGGTSFTCNSVYHSCATVKISGTQPLTQAACAQPTGWPFTQTSFVYTQESGSAGTATWGADGYLTGNTLGDAYSTPSGSCAGVPPATTTLPPPGTPTCADVDLENTTYMCTDSTSILMAGPEAIACPTTGCDDITCCQDDPAVPSGGLDSLRMSFSQSQDSGAEVPKGSRTAGWVLSIVLLTAVVGSLFAFKTNLLVFFQLRLVIFSEDMLANIMLGLSSLVFLFAWGAVASQTWSSIDEPYNVDISLWKACDTTGCLGLQDLTDGIGAFTLIVLRIFAMVAGFASTTLVAATIIFFFGYPQQDKALKMLPMLTLVVFCCSFMVLALWPSYANDVLSSLAPTSTPIKPGWGQGLNALMWLCAGLLLVLTGVLATSLPTSSPEGDKEGSNGEPSKPDSRSEPVMDTETVIDTEPGHQTN